MWFCCFSFRGSLASGEPLHLSTPGTLILQPFQLCSCILWSGHIDSCSAVLIHLPRLHLFENKISPILLQCLNINLISQLIVCCSDRFLQLVEINKWTHSVDEKFFYYYKWELSSVQFESKRDSKFQQRYNFSRQMI